MLSARQAKRAWNHIATSKPLYVVFDGGNTDVKAMVHGWFGKEIIFPHSVTQVSEAEYGILQERYKYRRADFKDSAIFRSRGQGFSVGRHSQESGDGQRITGVRKYTRKHYGALFEAYMLIQYPKSHDDVRVVVLHPADVDEKNMKRLARSLLGEHTVRSIDGKEDIVWNVREIIPIEEPIAGLQNAILNVNGEEYQNERLPIKPNTSILVLDVGGWLTSGIVVLITSEFRFEPIFTGSPVYQIGIQDVIDKFQPELKRQFPKQLGQLQEIPLDMMHNALLNGYITIADEKHDCSLSIKRAMQALEPILNQMWNGKFFAGVNLGGVCISGGGGGLAYNYITTTIIIHKNTVPSERDLPRQRVGNIRGASKGLMSEVEG